MAMAEARGAILVALARAGVEVDRVRAQHDQAGRHRARRSAGKAQVRAMVAPPRRRPSPQTDHAADALAAAICHLSSAPLRGAIRRAR